jgi:hypothetical protein
MIVFQISAFEVEANEILGKSFLSREDTIDLTIGTAKNPNEVEFQLETVASITSGKALELRSHSDSLIYRVKTQNANHGPQQYSLPAANLLGTRLTLTKAKLFWMSYIPV